MKKDILVVVDMQNDFIDGALGTKEAEAIVDSVVEKIKNFDGLVLATRDTHPENYMSTQEGKNLPVEHCIEGSDGWQIRPEIAELIDEKNIFNKPTFGSIDLAKKIVEINENETVNSVTFIGLCTGICVLSNAITLKAHLPELPIMVDSKCCACVTPESHQTALDAMKLCQVAIL